jgi:hypothetical protein
MSNEPRPRDTQEQSNQDNNSTGELTDEQLDDVAGAAFDEFTTDGGQTLQSSNDLGPDNRQKKHG